MLHWDAKWRVSSMGEYQGNIIGIVFVSEFFSMSYFDLP